MPSLIVRRRGRTPRRSLDLYQFGVDIPLAAGWTAEAASAIRPAAGFVRAGDLVHGVGTVVWTPGTGSSSGAELVYPEWTPEDGEPSWEGGLPDVLLPTVNVRGIVAWAYEGDFPNSGESVMLQVNRTGQVIVGAGVVLAPEAPFRLLLDSVRWLAI